ncbi:serpin B3-like [Culicoides brevitarsis]|uniref:serpin B3-like n=1 Tax=Culicoides brevitarsis TaxID=469753 RepID=UPI00307BB041
MALNRFSKTSYRFGIELYENFISDDDNYPQNIVFSPFLVQIALSTILMGAVGKTFEEIGVVLKYGKNCKKAQVAYQFHEMMLQIKKEGGLMINNEIFVQRGYNLHAAFLNITKNCFDARVTKIDFNNKDSAVEEINKYVENNTNGAIKDVVSSEDIKEFTRALAVNTIYFKGAWRKPFDVYSTRKMPFWTTTTEYSDVDMMVQRNRFAYGTLEKLDVTVIELQYNQSDVSMMIFLPNKKDGLKILEDGLKKLDLDFVRSQMQKDHVALYLPKFKFEFTQDLEKVLKSLGMKAAFEEDLADFRHLKDPNDDETFFVSKIVHKAFIKVDEAGTEAAAAVRIILCGGGPSPTYRPFVADHPFMFMLVLNNFMMFAGVVNDPADFLESD